MADAHQMADALLREYGSLKRIFSSSAGRLERTAGGRVAEIILSSRRLALDALRPDPTRPIFGRWEAVESYLSASLAGETVEHVRGLYLDRNNGLIQDRFLASGTIDECTIHLREIMRAALDLGAAALILVHNHPSGDCLPSRSDIEFTKAAIAAGRPLLVTLHDHLIVGRDEVRSMRGMGIGGIWANPSISDV